MSKNVAIQAHLVRTVPKDHSTLPPEYKKLQIIITYMVRIHETYGFRGKQLLWYWTLSLSPITLHIYIYRQFCQHGQTANLKHQRVLFFWKGYLTWHFMTKQKPMNFYRM